MEGGTSLPLDNVSREALSWALPGTDTSSVQRTSRLQTLEPDCSLGDFLLPDVAWGVGPAQKLALMFSLEEQLLVVLLDGSCVVRDLSCARQRPGSGFGQENFTDTSPDEREYKFTKAGDSEAKEGPREPRPG